MITHNQLLSFEYLNHRNQSNGERQNSWCLDLHSSHDIIILFLFIYVVLRLLKKIITKRRTIPTTAIIIDPIRICLISISNQRDKTVVQYDFHVSTTSII